MCGIAGIIRRDAREEDRLAIRAMSECLGHRGSDGNDIFSRHGVHLAHRRLAIIDPQNGSQPMRSHDGSLTII